MLVSSSCPRPTVTPLWDTAGTNQIIPSNLFPSQSICSDTHYYEAFGDLAKLSHDQHIDSVCSLNTQLQGQYNNRPVVVGEWSIGTGIGCTPYQDCQSFTMQDSINSFNTAEGNVFLRRFFEAQASTFEKNAGGWIFWSWKTEVSKKQCCWLVGKKRRECCNSRQRKSRSELNREGRNVTDAFALSSFSSFNSPLATGATKML